jgi:type IX secretion system substrate protein
MKCFILLAILFLSLFSKGQTTFNKRFHLGFPAAIMSGVIPTDSCYYGIGIVLDSVYPHPIASFFAKFDLQGNTIFVKTLSDPDKWHDTRVPAFVISSDNNFVAAGITLDSIRKIFLIKYTPGGDTIFTKSYLHPLYPQESFVYLANLTTTDDGGFIMTGNLEMPAGINNTDILVLKTDSLGNEIFKKNFGTTSFDELSYSVIRAGTGYIIGALQNNGNTSIQNYSFRTLIIRIDSVGQKQWQYLSPIDSGLRDAANDMVLLDDGSLVVASGVGTEIDHPSVNVVYFDKYVFKLNPDGEIEWELTFPDSALTSWSTTTKILKLTDGSGYLLAGMAYNALPPPKYFIVSGWLSKITPDGDSIWTRKFAFLNDGQDEHKIYDLKETPDGGFILCGEARDWSGTDSIPQQAWLLKLDEYGCLVPGCYTATEEPAGGEPAISLAIYPNPASDYLNFYLRTSHPAREASFRIVNAEGRLMKTFQIDRPDATYIVPVWDWAAGVYILQYVEEGVVRVSEKFIVSSL